jgi:hypothetical protein
MACSLAHQDSKSSYGILRSCTLLLYVLRTLVAELTFVGAGLCFSSAPGVPNRCPKLPNPPACRLRPRDQRRDENKVGDMAGMVEGRQGLGSIDHPHDEQAPTPSQLALGLPCQGVQPRCGPGAVQVLIQYFLPGNANLPHRPSKKEEHAIQYAI